VFAQVGGYLADRYDRRKLMIAMDAIAGVAVLGYLVAIQRKSLDLVFAATMVRSAIGAAYYPVTTGIVPLLVPNGGRDLQYAVTMNGYAWSVMAILGGAIAGAGTAIVGLRACYVLDSLTYFLSAAVVYYGIAGNYNVSRPRSPSIRTVSDAATPTTATGVKDGSTFTDSSRNVVDRWMDNCRNGAVGQLSWYLWTCGFGLLVLLKPSASFVWGPEDVIGSLFATVRDDGNDSGIGQQDAVEEGKSSVRTGLLFSVVGIGCLIGPTLANVVTDANKPRTLQLAGVTGLLILTCGWFAISFAPNFAWFLVCTVFRTMGSAIVWVFSTMILQSLTDKELLGRVLSVEYTLYTLTEAASATATGRLDDAGFDRNALALFAASLGAVTVAFWGSYHLLSGGAASPKFNRKWPPHGEPVVSALSLELPSVAELEEGTIEESSEEK